MATSTIPSVNSLLGPLLSTSLRVDANLSDSFRSCFFFWVYVFSGTYWVCLLCPSYCLAWDCVTPNSFAKYLQTGIDSCRHSQIAKAVRYRHVVYSLQTSNLYVFVGEMQHAYYLGVCCPLLCVLCCTCQLLRLIDTSTLSWEVGSCWECAQT